MEAISQKYIQFLQKFGIMLQIETAGAPDSPRAELCQTEEGFLLRLNPNKLLPELGCEPYIAYHARKVLLPRLVLETERLVLRRFQMEDAKDCFAFLSDPETCHWDGFEAFTEMDEEYAGLMERYASQETRYVIVRKDTGRVIGMVSLKEDDSRAVEAMEIGYNISPLHRRKGFGLEAVSALLHLLQADLQLEMVLAGVMQGNYPSEAMLRKLGFQFEGTRHKTMWHDALGPIDLDYYYLDKN